MSGTAVLSTVSTLWLVDAFLYRYEPASMTWFQILGTLLLLFPLAIIPGAFLVRKWSDDHFGIRGAIRWIFFGVLFGCLSILLVTKLLDPLAQLERGAMSFLIKKSVGAISVWGIAYLSHFLVFRFPKRIMSKR